MRVIPKEANRRPHHGSAKNGQFPDLWHTWHIQVGSKSCVSTDISQDREGTGGDDSAADGQPIQSVSQVHSIARPIQYEHDEEDKGKEGYRPEMRILLQMLDDQIRAELLEEGNDQLGRIQPIGLHGDER